MSYQGNPALAAAVKDRILSTFRQTVALYRQGRTEEVAAGCSLILQMDPMFDPAKKLLEKTRNPSLPLDLDSLAPAEEGDPLEQAREALAARDFQRVIHLTGQVLANDMLNDEARILGDQASERLEAGPFVVQFARKCDENLAAGDIAAAKAQLEKARSLDPTHPELERMARAIAARESTSRPSAPSFVVDDAAPQAPGRSTAQASDFGFAFEEEKGADSFANYSFDTPQSGSAPDFGSFFDAPAPNSSEPQRSSAESRGSADAPPSGPGEFDFATAAIVSSPDDQMKIDQFLADGDRAFEAGDYQTAIDLWSRIFLIDVTNDQASDRIERAKLKRREIDQKVEGMLTSAVEAFDRGDAEKARTELSAVLSIDPGNVTAQGYFDRLGELSGGKQTAPSRAEIEPSMSDDALGIGFFEDESASSLGEQPLIPPPPPGASASRAAAASKKAASPAHARGRRLPIGAIAAAIGVLVLLAGAWFAWTRLTQEPETDPAATQALLARASMLASSGKYDQAIALLRDVKPDDPQHDEALVMIADLQQKKSSSAQMIDGVPAAAYYNQQIAAATAALAAHDYTGAKVAFEQAMRVKPLSAELKMQYDAAAQQVANLSAARALFNERKYEQAIANLEPLLAKDPDNQNIRRMIVDARFNLGVTALQEERVEDAVREFDAVLQANPDDELARRSRELALRYQGTNKDLLYRIYVKYLPLRQAG